MFIISCCQYNQTKHFFSQILISFNSKLMRKKYREETYTIGEKSAICGQSKDMSFPLSFQRQADASRRKGKNKGRISMKNDSVTLSSPALWEQPSRLPPELGFASFHLNSPI